MNILLPAMGEGVIEATVTRWLVEVGKEVREYDPVVEVATDKVDSEVPSPADGRIVSIEAPEGSVVKIGGLIAVIETSGDNKDPDKENLVQIEVKRIRDSVVETRNEIRSTEETSRVLRSRTPSGKFISPLVRSIAAKENISYDELDKLQGTGMDGRITRDDILFLIEKNRINLTAVEKSASDKVVEQGSPKASGDSRTEVITMDRVRKLIADHMVMSKRTSPHVTSFIDVDVTKLVNWRNSVKDKFLSTEGQKLTLTPIFIEVTARALSEFPWVNVSVEGENIIRKKDINIGMAAALPDGNLIVPVIRNANEKSLTGLAIAVNDLADRARKNKLKPDEITGGTFTITNYGTVDTLAGTPIINQPQAAILGTGAIRKMPAVVETPEGDMIAVRQIMILSLSYDHRVIDGALAGKFLARIRDLLRNYSPDLF